MTYAWSKKEHTILVRCVSIPGGRGRNSAKWEATVSGWLQCHSGQSLELALGKVLKELWGLGELPCTIEVKQVHDED